MKDRSHEAAFGQCVRELRKRLGITQEGLAMQAGIDRGYMGALERGKHSPTIGKIYQLLPALQVTFAEFAAEYDKCLRRVHREQKRNGTL